MVSLESLLCGKPCTRAWGRTSGRTWVRNGFFGPGSVTVFRTWIRNGFSDLGPVLGPDQATVQALHSKRGEKRALLILTGFATWRRRNHFVQACTAYQEEHVGAHRVRSGARRAYYCI